MSKEQQEEKLIMWDKLFVCPRALKDKCEYPKFIKCVKATKHRHYDNGCIYKKSSEDCPACIQVEPEPKPEGEQGVCKRCKGKKYTLCAVDRGLGVINEKVKCSRCKGTGKEPVEPEVKKPEGEQGEYKIPKNQLSLCCNAPVRTGISRGLNQSPCEQKWFMCDKCKKPVECEKNKYGEWVVKLAKQPEQEKCPKCENHDICLDNVDNPSFELKCIKYNKFKPSEKMEGVEEIIDEIKYLVEHGKNIPREKIKSKLRQSIERETIEKAIEKIEKLIVGQFMTFGNKEIEQRHKHHDAGLNQAIQKLKELKGD